MSAPDPRSTIQAPKGWSKSDDALSIDGYWGADEEGQFMAQRHGLPAAKPLLIQEGGDVLYLFQSGNNYYFWDPVQSEVARIIEPTSLPNIVEALNEKGGASVITKVVKQLVSM